MIGWETAYSYLRMVTPPGLRIRTETLMTQPAVRFISPFLIDYSVRISDIQLARGGLNIIALIAAQVGRELREATARAAEHNRPLEDAGWI